MIKSQGFVPWLFLNFLVIQMKRKKIVCVLLLIFMICSGFKPNNGQSVSEEETVTLVMAGDMLMHMPVNRSGMRADGDKDFSHLFTYTKKYISNADIAIVNQEVILGGEELGITGYPMFNTYYEVGDALANAGFDVVLHATNHAMDRGKDGLMNCISYWENNHPDITYLGIQDTEEEQDEIFVFEKKGIKISILNYTYGLNGLPLPEDMPYAVNLMDKEKMAEDIKKANEISDFVVVCPHWGTEYVLKASAYQKDYAQFFLENGVDLVIGTHPHVIEPVEILKDDSGNEMLVYYSLGNYVNSTASEENDIGKRMLGAMAEVTVTRNDDGEVVIESYDAHPLVTYVSANKKTISVFPLEMFNDELAKKSFTVKLDTNFSKSYCEDIWNSVMCNLIN